MSLTSQGTKWYYDASTTPVKVVKVRRAAGNREHETADVTHLESSAREHIGLGLVNNGDMEFDVILDHGETTHTALRTKIAAGTLESMKLERVKTGGTVTATFNAIVVGFQEESAVGAEQTATVTVRISGGITYT